MKFLREKLGCGGNAGLMESKENIKPFPTLPTVLGNHQRTVITTFPPHGDYYWIWTLLLCSRQDISALQQQDLLAPDKNVLLSPDRNVRVPS
jgi:hypothetical protein